MNNRLHRSVIRTKSESEAQMIQHENKTSAAPLPPEAQIISNNFNLFFNI